MPAYHTGQRLQIGPISHNTRQIPTNTHESSVVFDFYSSCATILETTAVGQYDRRNKGNANYAK